jgi:hypothetical protein
LAGFDPAKDKFKGNEEYGDLMTKKSAWARKFDDINYQSLVVESIDKSYKKEYTRDQIHGKLNTDDLLKDKAKIKKAGGCNVYIHHDAAKDDSNMSEIEKVIQEDIQRKINEREALKPAREAFETKMA